MKHHKIFDYARSFSYTFFSNMLSTLISMLVTLIVPKMIGVASYGYFQLYMMYITFLGIFHLGWVDGLYLRIGGKKYEELDSKRFSLEFAIFEMLEVSLGIIGGGFAFAFATNVNKEFVLIASCICMVIYNSDIFIQFILLATAEVKQYSQFIILDRLTYFIFLIGFLITGITTYRQLIIADLAARFVILVYEIYKNRRLILDYSGVHPRVWKEIKEDITSGYKVTLGGVAGIFITVIVRSFIENKWGIKTFGQVSLSFTLSNLLMVFVNAVSLVLFPILKRTSDEHLSTIYRDLRTLLMVVLLGCLVFYQPLAGIVGAWLPKYAASLRFLALMFPMVIFNSKTSMLITTYLKSLRLERYILISNVLAVAVSTILSYVAVYLLNNQILAIITIVVGIALRSIYSEAIIAKHLDVSVYKDVALEVMLSAIFMYYSWNFSPLMSTICYTICYLAYLLLKRRDVKQVVMDLKHTGGTN